MYTNVLLSQTSLRTIQARVRNVTVVVQTTTLTSVASNLRSVNYVTPVVSKAT